MSVLILALRDLSASLYKVHGGSAKNRP